MCNVFFGLFAVTVLLTGVLCNPPGVQDLQKLADANNELALNLHKRLSSSGDNVFFSPLSISAVFAMLHYGARGETKQELRTALGYQKADLSDEKVPATFRRFLQQVTGSGNSSNGYVLKSANAILVDKHLQLVPGYKDEVEDFFDTTVQDVDFRTQSAAVVDDINRWVREKTNGKIESLLDQLDSSTLVILLNAVYFKGTWKYQFEPLKTLQQRFYNDGVESRGKFTHMMKMTARFNFATIENVKVLEIPYEGDAISMVILLPYEWDGLAALEASLNLEKLATIRQQLRNTTVDVSIPKFKLRYTKELSQEMTSLGAKEIFGSADLSGMVGNSTDVSVSEVLHKAVVEVNEEGSEAAAATAVRVYLRRPDPGASTPSFTANHPFLFAIVEKSNDMILFMGRVTKF